MTIPKRINPEFYLVIKTLCQDWFNRKGGRPRYLGKKNIQKDVIDQYKISGMKKLPDVYIKRVTATILKREFGYACSPGNTNDTPTYWLMEGR